MIKYDQIPEFVPGGNPTEYKEWIAFILDQIRLVKGDGQFTSIVDTSISDIQNKDITNVIRQISRIAFVQRRDGLYESPEFEHGLSTRNVIAEVYSSDSKEPMSFTILPITDNTAKIVLYEPENVIVSLDV